MANAKPDEHGRYRVINAAGNEYSTYRYIKDAHKIAGGPASDSLGRALPPVHAGAEVPHIAPELSERNQNPPEQPQAVPADQTKANKEANES
jgi:hypothetical protein